MEVMTYIYINRGWRGAARALLVSHPSPQPEPARPEGKWGTRGARISLGSHPFSASRLLLSGSRPFPDRHHPALANATPATPATPVTPSFIQLANQGNMSIVVWDWIWGGHINRDAVSESMAKASPPPQPMHPYYPLGVAIPNYEANTATVPTLILSLGGMLASVMLLMSTVALRVNPTLTKSSLAVICWFVLCKSSSKLGRTRSPFFPTKPCHVS